MCDLFVGCICGSLITYRTYTVAVDASCLAMVKDPAETYAAFASHLQQCGSMTMDDVFWDTDLQIEIDTAAKGSRMPEGFDPARDDWIALFTACVLVNAVSCQLALYFKRCELSVSNCTINTHNKPRKGSWSDIRSTPDHGKTLTDASQRRIQQQSSSSGRIYLFDCLLLAVCVANFAF